MESSDVVVVGAGVVGCAAAFWLARAGLTVTVVERDDVARHASSLSASALLPLGDDAESGPLSAAGWASLEVWDEIEEELEDVTGEDLRIARCGALRLGDEHTLRERAESLEAFGCRWVSGADLDEIAPGLGAPAGALWSPREARADGARLTRALARGAEHYGARFAVDTRVAGVAMASGCLSGVVAEDGALYAAGEVVFCTGPWSAAIGAWLDHPLPVESQPVLAVSVAPPRPSLDPVICASGLRVVPGEGEIWVRSDGAGFGNPDGLLDAARGFVPTLGTRARRSFSGSTSATSDRLPLVGRAPGVEGGLLAVGHAQSHVLLAALTGSGVAELLVEGTFPDELRAFAPDR